MNPLPLIDGCLFIDNSHFIEPIMECDRKHEYTFLNKRLSTLEKSSLNFGTSIHEALEYKYRNGYNADVVAHILSEFFEKHPVQTDDWRNLNWSIEVMKNYEEKYAIEPFSLLSYDHPVPCVHCNGNGLCIWCKGRGQVDVIVEMPFAVHLYDHEDVNGSTAVLYSGKIDLALAQSNALWVLDTKTNKDLGSFFWDDMQRSSQQRGYVWAFDQVTGKRPVGYIVNGIRTKEAPEYVRKGGTFKGKKKSMTEWWNESFQRERYYVDDDQLDEWKNNTIELCEKFFWQYSRGYFPINTKSCSRYGRCQYWEICTTERKSRNIMLQSTMFTDNSWTPLIKPSSDVQ